MSFLWIVVALLVAIAAVAIGLVASGRIDLSRNANPAAVARETQPYQMTKTLFTPAERSFLGVLDQAVGVEYRVFGKVRIGDIAVPKSGLGPSVRTTARNRVEKKHFDFVVCRASDLVPVCAVELNDKTHTRRDRQERDDFVVEVCEAIGLPLLQPRAAGGYVVSDLRAQFFDRVRLVTDRAVGAASL